MSLKTFLALLLVCCLLDLHAQSKDRTEQVVEPQDIIEKTLYKCLMDSHGAVGSKCLEHALEAWHSLIDEKYKMLLSAMPDEEKKQSLVEAQAKWESYEKAEIAFSEKLETWFNKQHPHRMIYSEIAFERKISLVKARISELKAYCVLLGIDQ